MAVSDPVISTDMQRIASALLTSRDLAISRDLPHLQRACTEPWWFLSLEEEDIQSLIASELRRRGTVPDLLYLVVIVLIVISSDYVNLWFL